MAPNFRPTSDDFLNSVENDARLMADSARKGLEAAVPTCPGWTVRDLLVHTGVIYRRKEQVVLKGLTDRETDAAKPDGDPIGWFEEGTRLMLAALRSKESSDHTWTWHDPDQTVGFWKRRMAQESLIHRIDAELAHGEVSQVDSTIAEDGIDEALDIFIGGYPPWATVESEKSVIKLSSPNRNWFLRKGSFSGTTRSGRVFTDIPTVLVETDAPKWDCEITGESAAIDLWLWGRGPLTDLEVSGDSTLADYLRYVAAEST